ncbi:28998_t:CDS:2, partial [Gigaspora margarita]
MCLKTYSSLLFLVITVVAQGNFTAQSLTYSSFPQVIIDNKDFITPDLVIEERINNLKFNRLGLFRYLKKLSISSYVPVYNTYKKVAEEINPDLFFCDHFVNNPCYDLAWKLGKPVVGTTILSPLQSIWMALTTVRDLNIQRAKVGVEPHWDPKGRISNILMLFDTFFGYEVPSAESPLYQEIGPILSDTYPGLTPTLNSFLNEHPRTMYFAIGTIALLSPQSTSILLKSFLELIDHDIIDAGSCQESIYNAIPMLILPACCDHFGNAERMELAGMALKISKDDLNVNDIVSKIKRLLNDESFKLNAERLQFSSKINSKRKYRGADLIEIILNNAMYEGIKDENGRFKIDNEKFLKDWITPDIKMGYIKGNYLD